MASLVHTGKSAILDMSGVTFIASMGVRMLISVARSMKQRQIQLALYHAQPLVNETLDSVSLSQVIPVVDDESVAIARLSS